MKEDIFLQNLPCLGSLDNTVGFLSANKNNATIGYKGNEVTQGEASQWNVLIIIYSIKLTVIAINSMIFEFFIEIESTIVLYLHINIPTAKNGNASRNTRFKKAYGKVKT